MEKTIICGSFTDWDVFQYEILYNEMNRRNSDDYSKYESSGIFFTG